MTDITPLEKKLAELQNTYKRCWTRLSQERDTVKQLALKVVRQRIQRRLENLGVTPTTLRLLEVAVEKELSEIGKLSCLSSTIMNSADLFGSMLSQAWESFSQKTPFDEVQLFRKFKEAILSLAPPFKVEEFHGFKHQVVFAGTGSWGRKIARCELSDLMVITYCTKPRFEARLTFLQAKKSGVEHHLCSDYPQFSVTTAFAANLEQWDLLSRRPPIIGIPPFDPPADLLRGAILPSVGSFGVFSKQKGGRKCFFYVSADMLKPVGSPLRKQAALSTLTGACERIQQGFTETPLTCCIGMFGRELYSRRIGTPIENSSEVSAEDRVYRETARRWLFQLLRAYIRRADQEQPVTMSFLRLLEGNQDFAELKEPTSPDIIVINSDDLGANELR